MLASSEARPWRGAFRHFLSTAIEMKVVARFTVSLFLFVLVLSGLDVSRGDTGGLAVSGLWTTCGSHVSERGCLCLCMDKDDVA